MEVFRSFRVRFIGYLPIANVYKTTWAVGSVNGPFQTGINISSSTTYQCSCYMWIPSSYGGGDAMPEIDFDIGMTGIGGSTTVGKADTTKRDQV
jgi:hypothetical protein